MSAAVVAVHAAPDHSPSKPTVSRIELLAGIGVAGDTHSGPTVQHRSRVASDPGQPNLRQVHLIPEEMFEVVAAKGFAVGPGDLGENITTRGIDLGGLPSGSLLSIGSRALVALTGFRTPCHQIDGVRPGLLSAFANDIESPVDKPGVMAVVVVGGDVEAGDEIRVTLPDMVHVPLGRV